MDLKTELWAAASEAFPDAEVTLKPLAAGHPKLATRKLPASYLVRVSLVADSVEIKTVVVRNDGLEVPTRELKPVKVPYAVSGLYPQDGSVEGIKGFIEDLKSDSVRISDSFPK